jgi:regulator of replication initiation timing
MSEEERRLEQWQLECYERDCYEQAQQLEHQQLEQEIQRAKDALLELVGIDVNALQIENEKLKGILKPFARALDKSESLIDGEAQHRTAHVVNNTTFWLSYSNFDEASKALGPQIEVE